MGLLDSLIEKALDSDVIDKINDITAPIEEKINDASISGFNKLTGDKYKDKISKMTDMSWMDDDKIDKAQGKPNQNDKVAISSASDKKNRVQTKPVKKTSPAMGLQKKYQRLHSQQERALTEIKGTGENFLGSLFSKFFSDSSKVSNYAKIIIGKTKDEKIQETLEEYDNKIASLFEKIIIPTDENDLWEMLIVLHSLSKKAMGPKSSASCNNLYKEVWERSQIIVASEDKCKQILHQLKPDYSI